MKISKLLLLGLVIMRSDAMETDTIDTMRSVVSGLFFVVGTCGVYNTLRSLLDATFSRDRSIQKEKDLEAMVSAASVGLFVGLEQDIDAEFELMFPKPTDNPSEIHSPLESSLIALQKTEKKLGIISEIHSPLESSLIALQKTEKKLGIKSEIHSPSKISLISLQKTEEELEIKEELEKEEIFNKSTY